MGPDSKDRGVDLRAVVLIANMPRSIGWRERGGGSVLVDFHVLFCGICHGSWIIVRIKSQLSNAIN